VTFVRIEARRLRELEGENSKLKKLLAQAMLDIEALKVVARGLGTRFVVQLHVDVLPPATWSPVKNHSLPTMQLQDWCHCSMRTRGAHLERTAAQQHQSELPLGARALPVLSSLI
jgi:hypothetical protein